MSQPLVTIGMPVYNGGPKTRRALDSLLAQSHSNFELVISDNASTDGVTQQILEEYARRDQRIRVVRQQDNMGPLANFLWLLPEARGEYFVWAAHDDAWSPNFIECLVNRLLESPAAVLATPSTAVVNAAEATEKYEGKQQTQQTIVPSAPNKGRWDTLELLLARNICVWIYGLYRTEWLRSAAPKLADYPLHGGDRLWLFDLVLSAPVVGDQSATFFYSDSPGKRKDRSARAKMRFLGLQIYHMFRLCWTRLPSEDRLKGLRFAAWYIYRQQITRNNPFGTAIRMLKIAVLGTWFALEEVTFRLIGRHRTAS